MQESDLDGFLVFGIVKEKVNLKLNKFRCFCDGGERREDEKKNFVLTTR